MLAAGDDRSDFQRDISVDEPSTWEAIHGLDRPLDVTQYGRRHADVVST
jgi:hypothetical protein